MFRKIASRIGAALGLATPAEKQTIADKLQVAIETPSTRTVPNEVEPFDPNAYVRRRNSIGHRNRSIRKGTQSRFHAKRGYSHVAAENHALSHSKPYQFINNPLLHKLLSQAEVFKAAAPGAVVVDGAA